MSIRYEDKKKQLNEQPEELRVLLEEYKDIQKKLEEATEKSTLYTDLIKLITKIADYIFREEPNVKKGLGDVMGGQILELESERLMKLGKESSLKEIVLNMLSKKKFSYEEIADLTGITAEEVRKIEREQLVKN